MSNRINSPLILSRNYYVEHQYGAHPSRSGSRPKGWTYRKSKAYEPFGEMCNVYKGCKFLKRKLSKYDIDLSIPIAKPRCEFLKGKDAEFVVEARKLSLKKKPQPNNRSVQSKVYATNEDTANGINEWLKWRRNSKSRNRNDGMDLLKEELGNSIIRLRNAQKNTFKNSTYMLTKKYQTALNKSRNGNKKASASFFRSTTYGKCKQEIANTSQGMVSDLSLITSKSKEPYLKLVSLRELSAKVKESMENGGTSVDKGECNAKTFLELIEKECSKYNEKYSWIIMPKGSPKKNESTCLTKKVVEACEEFEKTKEKLKNKLISSLNTQRNRRPKTVSYKRRNLHVSTNTLQRDCDLVKCRVAAEKDKVTEYKELTQKYASAYYSLAKFILLNEYEDNIEVVNIMDYMKETIEGGQRFTKDLLESYVHSLKCIKSPAKRYELNILIQNRVIRELCNFLR